MARRKPKPRRSPAGRLWSGLWKSALAFALIGVIVLVAAVGITMASLPSYAELMKSQVGQAVRVKSADGIVLVNQGPSYGGWLTYDEIPPVMVQAMVAVEDKRFLKHFGIDPIGIARAIKVNLETDSRRQGASTITQQLARNIFLSNDRSWERKLREALLALAMERKFSKAQILELYLNRVYFGGGAYGVDAASRRFFGHSATSLDAAEASIIAGLVKAPSRFAPSSDPERARARAVVVAGVLEELGVVDNASAVRSEIAAIEFAPQPRQNDVRYFTDWVLQQVDALIDERSEALIVTTTLLAPMQQAAERTVKEQTPPGVQGALVSMSHDGAVRAMMGGRDYVDSNYNRATIAERQPGSAWKLFVYLAAIEGGVLPDDYVNDVPVTIEGWSPRNYGRSYRGEISVREAFARSSNTVAAQLAARQGFGTVADMARRFGIETDISRRPAMALGTSTVRLIEMTAAYAGIARGGVGVEPYGIERIETARGRLLYERDMRTPRVLVAPWVATNMTNLLEAAVNSGTGGAAKIDRPIAGKTGTTSDYRDGYFIGFSAQLTTGVWMGRDDNKPVSGLTGGSSPARAFAAYMKAASGNLPVVALDGDIRIDDMFAEPDAEVYGLDGDWPSQDPYYDDYGDYQDAPSYADPDYPPVGETPDVDVGYGAPPYVPAPAPAQPRRPLPSDMRAADVPTRPRVNDAWLDQRAAPAATARGAQAAPQPPPRRPAADGAPTVLLPADPVQ